MASPFSLFRKHQKIMIAVVGILAMFAFIFIGPWSRLGEHESGPQNQEVFSWKYGTVRENDIEERMAQRQLVNQFLYRTAEKAKLTQNELQQALYPVSERSLVEAMLFGKKAEQLGVVPSDDMVNAFIKAYHRDRVTSPELAQIIANLGSKERRVSQTQLFDALRQELAADYALASFSRLLGRGQHPAFAQFRGDTPADRWDYFSRMNRKVTTQLLPLTVASFVAEVKNPSEETLRAFYEQYKNVYPNPASPTPGFRQPFQAQFQYFKADNASLVAAEAKLVTDEDMKKYYDDFKDFYFKKAKLPAAPVEPSEKKPDDVKPGNVKPDDAKPDDAKPDDANPSDSKPGEPKADDSKSGEPKAGDGKAGDAKDDGKATDENKADGKQSSVRPGDLELTGELLALADEAAPAADAKAAPPVDTKSSDKADSEPKSDAPAKADDPTAAPAKVEPAKPAGGNVADPTADAAKPVVEAKPEPVEYEPLEKVADQVRDSVASQKVNKRVSEAFLALRQAVDAYRDDVARYDGQVKSGLTSAKKPEPITFAALAKQYGLEAKETELISPQQAFDDSDIGKSTRPLMAGSRQAPRFIEMAFTPALETYVPEESEDAENNRYLWWKIADKADNVPPLAEIDPRVVEAWKMIEARKLTEAKAKEYAAQATKAKQPLKEMFANVPGREVLTAGPFSWLTRQFTQFGAVPSLSEVSGVKYAGNDFFKAVFDLNQGETGVAANQPLTIYYVVQIEAEEPPLAELRDRFMAAMSSPQMAAGYAGVGFYENAGGYASLLKELEGQFSYRLAEGQTLSAVRRDVD